MARPEHDADVLIVGGGMVGLALGCALADAGFSAVIVDARPVDDRIDAGFDGRASAIAAGSARILANCGLWEALSAQAEPIREIRVSDRDSRLFLHYDHADLGTEPLGYMVENRFLRRALAERAGALPGLVQLAPRRIVELDRAADARAVLDDGQRITARVVAAVDGKESQTRARAGIAVWRRAYDQTAIVCTVAHERPHHGIAHERFLAAGPFAILPLPGNRSSLVWTERADLAPAMMALDDAAFLAEIQWRFTDFLGRLSLVGPRWRYPVELVRPQTLIGHRLVLAGDAAHAIHPIAGQGLNLGLRDAAALTEALVDAARLGLDIGSRAPLAHYQRRRQADSLTMTLATDGLNRLFTTESPALTAARRLGLAAVHRAPPLKRLFMRHAMGLTGHLPALAHPPG